ncbi:MAG: diguanylate cyclase [Candidatus Riflebacteria bacterium]|nr:diguanylate cyclase [Candidatus Riflebacteria bacterium]
MKEKSRFLFRKYRELKLIQKLDTLTDRYRKHDQLLYNSLKTISRFFNCELAAFLPVQNQNTNQPSEESGLILTSIVPEPSDKQKSAVKKILRDFLNEPKDFYIENSPSEDKKNSEIKNYVMVPMILRNDIEGAFFIANSSNNFTEDDAETLKNACSQLDNAVEFCRFVKEHRGALQNLSRRTRELEILYEMSLSLNYGYDIETLTRKILENVMNLLKIDRASIMRYDQKTDELSTFLVIGEKQKIRLVKLGMSQGIAGLAMASGKPILAPLGSEDRRFLPFSFTGIKIKKIFSFACIPLMNEETPIGVINLSMLSAKKSIKQSHLETISVAANMISLAFQRQEFYQMSIKDELTGLFSFRYFKERLAEEVTRSRRYKMPFSLVLFDLDHFKSVNDTYGHPFGNIVLKKVSDIIIKNIRVGVDMPARFGGEELAVILPHTDSAGAEIVSQRIRAQVEELSLEFEKRKVKISISGGISSFPNHSNTADILLKKADEALYKAKETGRNKVVIALT